MVKEFNQKFQSRGVPIDKLQATTEIPKTSKFDVIVVSSFARREDDLMWASSAHNYYTKSKILIVRLTNYLII